MTEKEKLIDSLESLGVEFGISTEHPQYAIVSPLDGDGEIAADFYFNKKTELFIAVEKG